MDFLLFAAFAGVTGTGTVLVALAALTSTSTGPGIRSSASPGSARSVVNRRPWALYEKRSVGRRQMASQIAPWGEADAPPAPGRSFSIMS